MIKELIVVEGRDDITAVKKAVDAHVYALGGFAINAAKLEIIKKAQERQGVIILTDPDFVGEKIRSIISKRIPDVKHAYISRQEGTKNGDIGVENATPSAIIEALNNAKCAACERNNEFNIEDMIYYGLCGENNSKEIRQRVGKTLRIGYCNAAQFVNRLNGYSITRKELESAVRDANTVTKISE